MEMIMAEPAPSRGVCCAFLEMSMPEYLVEPFDTGPGRLESMQAFINEKAAEGYALHQVIERSTYQWVLFFKRDTGVEQPSSALLQPA
jgi:hypothetical protein